MAPIAWEGRPLPLAQGERAGQRLQPAIISVHFWFSQSGLLV